MLNSSSNSQLVNLKSNEIPNHNDHEDNVYKSEINSFIQSRKSTKKTYKSEFIASEKDSINEDIEIQYRFDIAIQTDNIEEVKERIKKYTHPLYCICKHCK